MPFVAATLSMMATGGDDRRRCVYDLGYNAPYTKDT
jgi:hypothetical protein